MRHSDLLAAQRAVNAALLRHAEAAPRAASGWTPPKQAGLIKPCPRCGRAQPAGQSPADIRAYRVKEPTSVLYVRADGMVRAHAVGCELLPRGTEATPEVEREAPLRLPPRSAGLMGSDSPTEPAAVWADRRRPAPLAKPRGWQTNPGCWLGRAAIVRD